MTIFTEAVAQELLTSLKGVCTKQICKTTALGMLKYTDEIDTCDQNLNFCYIGDTYIDELNVGAESELSNMFNKSCEQTLITNDDDDGDDDDGGDDDNDDDDDDTGSRFDEIFSSTFFSNEEDAKPLSTSNMMILGGIVLFIILLIYKLLAK